ncbi:RNaseH domain-containing protein [Streptomyces gilvosporeus]|uniref:pPIWI-RE RNaseH domain-containing protein n=2 Tax=Streptomyces gilvosporeus TaxID=553510 RepID=A0A1V0U1H4_9ACTN|nr:RNaseH domain-containing protein [Streptomyces gilvosporeus]ARF58890.1 hypothetical protein B1H19_36115 [Streptomyces gilvosporeus]
MRGEDRRVSAEFSATNAWADTKQGQNPTSLEIHISFHQPDDDPADLAHYIHTDKANRLPLILHLAKLMEEYIP